MHGDVRRQRVPAGGVRGQPGTLQADEDEDEARARDSRVVDRTYKKERSAEAQAQDEGIVKLRQSLAKNKQIQRRINARNATMEIS